MSLIVGAAVADDADSSLMAFLPPGRRQYV